MITNLLNKLRKKKCEKILAFQRVFNQDTEDGRLALQYLLELTHLYDSSVSSEMKEMTYFQEGERNIGLQVINILNMPHHKLMELLNNNDEPSLH